MEDSSAALLPGLQPTEPCPLPGPPSYHLPGPPPPGQGRSARPALSLCLTPASAAQGQPSPSPSGDIAERVHRIEALLHASAGHRDPSPPKNLWFYKDGLRTPPAPPPAVSLAMPVRHVSTAEVTLSPRTVRARLGEPEPVSRSISTVAVTLANGRRLTTSFTGGAEDAPTDLSQSLCSLGFSDTSLPADLSCLATPTFSTPRARPPAVVGKPPALPPKAPAPAPPPRPASKELRLDDILLMCAEYERQIEREQREVRESVALSPARPGPGPEPLPPASPSATLQAPRIKTNGSLPRDAKRLPSPSRLAPGPTSPLALAAMPEGETQGVFTFERVAPVSPPPGRLSQEREEGGRRGPVLSASSPRTRIRTTLSPALRASQTSSSETLRDLPGSSNNSPASSLLRTSAPPTQFSLSDYQGGREGLADTDKAPEELYTEARDLLAALPCSSPSESPCSTGARRPPRPKQDSKPSAEAHQRLLIGTVMLSKHSGANLRSSPVAELKTERAATLTELNRAAQELAELSVQIEEAERSADLECSLIGAEMRGNEVDVANLSLRLEELTGKEQQLAASIGTWRRRHGAEMEEARARLETAELELDRLEEGQATGELDTDAETALLEQVKLKHEHLEAERKVFEDLEFRTMEEEAHLEAEIEDVSMVINKTQSELDAAETIVSEMELQKAEISVNQDVSILQERRETVAGQLAAEKRKLGELECRLREMLATTASRRSSGDSGTITWSDEESGRTAETVVRGGGEPRSERSSESTSDLPADSPDSRSPSPAPPPVRARRTSSRPALATPSPSPPALHPRPRRGGAARSSMELTTSGDEGRPLSGTDTASLWGPPCDGSWAGVSMRRAASSMRSMRGGQRPLTRYLPVTRQEGFDLRAHIETAGHQIELCKHIVINSCSCRGYLSKQGSRLRGWNRRWFVFDRNKRTLVYYGDKSEGKAKGGIYFHSISEVYVDHQKTQGAGQKATFIMKTHDRQYSLTAPSQEAMRIWVDVLFTGAEGYQEFQDLD